MDVLREVELVLLFGSVARGQARPDSDVDVAVFGSGLDRLTLAAEDRIGRISAHRLLFLAARDGLVDLRNFASEVSAWVRGRA
jgi:predicted nucleotidyltransferase